MKALAERKADFTAKADEAAKSARYDAEGLGDLLRNVAELILIDERVGLYLPTRPLEILDDPLFRPGEWMARRKSDEVRRRIGLELEPVDPALVPPASVDVYEPGTWGPSAAGRLAAPFGGWWSPGEPVCA